jgi:hypothetical protein
MKNITKQEALNLIQSASFVSIDNCVTSHCYPMDDNEDWWIDFLWEEDYAEFGKTFMNDCGDIQFDGTNLFIKDEDGDVCKVTLHVPMKVEL